MLSALILLTSLAMADEKVPVKEGFQTMDMKEFKDLDKTPARKDKTQFSTGCKTKTGVEYKQTDAGYEACVREIQIDNKRVQDPHSPTLQFNSPSVNFNTGG